MWERVYLGATRALPPGGEWEGAARNGYEAGEAIGVAAGTGSRSVV